MTTVYVSGPMSGYVDFNRPAFNAAAAYLESKGYQVVNPADLDVNAPLADDARHADFLRRDIRILVDECDLILMLPGWRYSKGAQGEKDVADLCGIDELTLADVELWRTFEGEPEQPPEDDEPLADWERELLHTNAPCEVVPILTAAEAAEGVARVAKAGVSINDLKPVKVAHVRRHSDVDCDAVEGDGQGNAWCTHGIQVSYAPELPQASDEFPDVPYVRHMTGCDGKRGGRCSLGSHVIDGANNLVHISGPARAGCAGAAEVLREQGIA